MAIVKKEELEQIETHEELEKKNQYLANNPFSSNKILYQGKPSIIHNNRVIDISRNRVSEDYFHKDYFLPQGYGRPIYKISQVYFPIFPFSIENPDSWLRIDYSKLVGGINYMETYDFDKYDSLSQIILTQLNEGEDIFVIHTSEELESLGFIKGTINSKYWFHKEEIKYLDKMLTYRKFDHIIGKIDIKQLELECKNDGFSLEQTRNEITKAINRNIKFGVDSITYKAFEGIRYTFGVELETCIGRLDQDQIDNLNIKAVHDGSLRDKNGNTPGGEYVTGVLTGDAGLTQLSEICRALTQRCKVNSLCGVHVHCGNLDWNKENIVYAYLLGELLEDEIYITLPKSRRSNSYCRRLTQLTLKYLPELKRCTRTEYSIIIDRLYDIIFKEITYVKGRSDIQHSLGEIGTEEVFTANENLNRTVQHPAGAKCGYEKSAQRYCWLNFITLLYNTKGGSNSQTLEIRSHSSTMNFKKVKNWIKIFFAFCRYVETNKSKIRKGKVTLADIVKKAYPKTGDNLIKYIEERKKLFNYNDESVDYVEVEEPKKQTIKEVAITN